MNVERYGNGENLPELHPDPLTNANLLIELLCAHLDHTRVALTRVLDMNVVTSAGSSMKDAVRCTLGETSPEYFAAESALPVMTERMQGVDCYWCEDGTPHRHGRSAPGQATSHQP